MILFHTFSAQIYEIYFEIRLNFNKKVDLFNFSKKEEELESWLLKQI